MKNIELKDRVVISKEVFKYLIKNISYPLSSHTFMEKCQCAICEALRCFTIDCYEDYKWLITELNDKRNIEINPMSEEEFDVSYKTMNSIGEKITIDV